LGEHTHTAILDHNGSSALSFPTLTANRDRGGIPVDLAVEVKAMSPDHPARRMTLRDLLMHTEKSCRQLIEHVHTSVFAQFSDFRDVSRPVRRRSHFPTFVALQNALNSLASTIQETQTLIEDVNQQLEEIRERANKERINRL
jgi:hypothetical protein